MFYWQEKDEKKPNKTRITTGEYYLHGYADGLQSRPRARQRTRRAREAYNKGFDAGQATKRAGTARRAGL